MNRLSQLAAAVLRWCARLLPPGRTEWAEAILAEADNVPAGCQRLAWLGGGMRLVFRESMIMRKAGAICAFAAAAGWVASLSWPRSPVNRVTVADRVSLLVTVALLAGIWVAGRWLVGPVGAGPTQRLVRAGGYSAILALTLGKASVERMRGPVNLGPGAGSLLWTGEVLFLMMMAIFTIVVIMATAQRSPVTTGTLLRGIAAGLPIGIAVFLFLPLGVTRYQASRVLPAVPQGALGALAWAAVLIAPAAAGVLAARRFTSGQTQPHAAGPASGFSAWLGKAFALYGASTDGAAESEARIRQGVAAGLVAGLTGAMLAVLLGTSTVALLPHDSQLLGWLYPHLSRAATLPAEQGAGGNAAGYLLLLIAVPFAGLGVGSIGALIATPDRAQPPGGGGPNGDDPPTVSPPPDGATDRSPDNGPALLADGALAVERLGERCQPRVVITREIRRASCQARMIPPHKRAPRAVLGSAAVRALFHASVKADAQGRRSSGCGQQCEVACWLVGDGCTGGAAALIRSLTGS